MSMREEQNYSGGNRGGVAYSFFSPDPETHPSLKSMINQSPNKRYKWGEGRINVGVED